MNSITSRVLVAMSGGVDSSCAAALLLRRGYAVEGVTMKLTTGLCCDIGSAQAVCSHLGILHRLIDLTETFERDIVRDFVREYRAGRTPNPCIRCNDLIKFQKLLSYARAEGFDALATGHYARIDQDPASGRMLLKKGVDPTKDQSYFLYRLTQDQLRHMLLPLGGMTKTEVREQARGLGLPSAERPESQEVCFIPDNDYRAFLKQQAPDAVKPGELILTNGTVVGSHDGIAFFTVGQRRKLGIAAGERLYVIRIEPETRRVVLGRKADLQVRGMRVHSPNVIALDRIPPGLPVEVKIRYRSPLEHAIIEPAGEGGICVRFAAPVVGVTPGQAAVFYDGDVVIGGGMIAASTTPSS